MVSEHHLTIPGVIEQVPAACSWVVQVAEDVGLQMRDVNHIELAVDEACTNIVEHGYSSSGTDRVIDIVVRRENSDFTITIIDDGPPFNPLVKDDPDPLAALDDRPEYGGGMGIFFIKKVMDRVDYEFANDRNHLIMRKNLA